MSYNLEVFIMTDLINQNILMDLFNDSNDFEYLFKKK